MDNLFYALNNWATQQYQDENFVTEAFVYILRELAQSNQTVAREVLKALTAGMLDIPESDLSKVRIQTHFKTEDLGGASYRFPDIELKYPREILVYIEVKVNSPLDPDQLRRYRLILETKRKADSDTAEESIGKYASVGLVGLATHDEWQKHGSLEGVSSLTWDAVRTLFLDCRPSAPELRFLLKQFAELLECKRLIEIPTSHKEAIETLASVAKKEGFRPVDERCRANWYGVYLSTGAKKGRKGQQFTLGKRTDNPRTLRFTTLNYKIDTDKTDTLVQSNQPSDGSQGSRTIEVFPAYGKTYYATNEGNRLLITQTYATEEETRQRDVIGKFLRECLRDAESVAAKVDKQNQITP